MKKICLLLLCCLGFAFANEVDATLEVVKKFGSLPNILVQNTGSDYSEREFSQRIFKMLIADARFISWLRSLSQATTIPVGI